MLSARSTRATTSLTMQVAAEAERLTRAGIDVVDFGAGEPDFATPDHVKAAACAAIAANKTKYTANAGVLELRAALCERYREDSGIDLQPQEVIITAGGKQALFNAMMALFGPGDEVITHAPGWASIPEQITLADATPVIVRTHADERFSLGPERFLAAIGPRTRGIVINSPCNPTGALMGEDALSAIADEAARRGIWVLLDLCYDQIVYEQPPPNLPRVLFERARDRAVLCGSTSKAYAMTGWRCGWAAGPEALIRACGVVQSHSTSNASSISQHAALAALSGPQQCVRAMREEYRRRRDVLWDLVARCEGLRCDKPSGAFYLFVDVTDVLSPTEMRTSLAFAQKLLSEEQVALTPGEGFDAPGFVRISYATSEDRLREGAIRIARFVRSLTR